MLEYLIDDKFVDKNDRIAVGVSGGADSMLLLWALIDKQKQVGFHLHVVNVNHNLRGAESDADSSFVKDFCEKKKISHTIFDADVKSLKGSQKMTLEESARKARYEAFAKIMKEEKLNKLFLAHHKNDQAETILMHIFRGAGVSGATGIKQSDAVIRPLLNLKKSEILNLAKEHGIKFVVDSSNEDNVFSRNYLRNIVIPAIEKVYPNVVDSLFEFGEKCKDVQKFIETNVKNEFFDEKKDYILLKDIAFEQNDVVVKETLKKAFEKLKIFSDIESKHFSILIELQKADVNKSVDLPHGVVAKRTYEGLKFMKKTSKEKVCGEYQFVIGEIEVAGFGKIETSFVSPEDVVYGEGALFVDYAKIPTHSIWRFRKDGDIFSKLGTGSKKLNDYFTDKKIDSDLRDRIPLLVSTNKVLVVANHDVSEKVKIDGETEQIVKIVFHVNWICWQFEKILPILYIMESWWMFGKFNIFKIIGMIITFAIVLFFVFKASITGSIV